MSKIILIAAAGENNSLGINGDLPWHLPNDFKRFKQLTSGHKIVMGRKTFETFPKPLPNREHVVITRDKNYLPKFDCKLFHSIKEAIDYSSVDAKVFVIGGGEIYKQAMPFGTHIELTRVHGEFQADTYFPEIDENEWNLVNEEFHPKDEKHKYDFTYQTFERKV